MDTLTFPRKFIVLGGLSLSSLLIVLILFSAHMLETINLSNQQLEGLKQVQATSRLIQSIQKHRGLSAGEIAGVSEVSGKRITINQHIKEYFTTVNNSIPEELKQSKGWLTIKYRWNYLDYKGVTMGLNNSFDSHSRLLQRLFAFQRNLADYYQLPLVNDIDSYYLTNTFLYSLPTTLELLGQVRGLGLSYLIHKSYVDKKKITQLLSKVDTPFYVLSENIRKLENVMNADGVSISESGQAFIQVVISHLRFIKGNILLNDSNINPVKFYELSTGGIDNGYFFLETLGTTLNDLLNQRVQEANNQLFVSLGFSIMLFVLVLYFLVVIHLSTRKSIDTLTNATHSFSKGNLDERVVISTRDELKQIATGFNEMADKLTQLMQDEKKDKAYLKAIVDSAQDALVQINLNEEIIGWSHQAERLFGWPKDKVMGKKLHNLIIPLRFQDKHLHGLKHFLSTGEGAILNKMVELVAIHHDGHEFPIELTVVPVTFNDNVEFNGFIRDITHRKQSEQVLRILAESGPDNELSIFELIVQQLAASQGARYALIARIDSKDSGQVNTIAVWSGDKIVDNFSYKLKGTPCHNVIKQDSCFYPNDIQQLFPEDHLLVDMHAEGYIGLALKDDKGTVLGVIALFDDKPMVENKDSLNLLRSLATRTSIELERAESDQQLQLSSRVFNDTHEGITITDEKMNIIDVNPAFCKITGYSREDVIGRHSRILSSGKQSPGFYRNMWQEINTNGHWQGEIWSRKNAGEPYAILLTISALKNDHGNVVNYVGVFTDITSSKQQQERLSLMAHYDVLTGLPNRTLFVDRFHQAIAHSKRTKAQLAVCFLDLDNFKPINDNFGHGVGDQLLVKVAERIKASIREEDTVSRQGGDEFAILLNDIDTYAQCEQTLERLHHSLAEPYLINGHTHKITASSGITLYPSDDADIDTLLRHADQAMYQAKVAGKHCYHLFNAEHDQLVIRKHNRLKIIEFALANDEFELYYQPKVNMVTGELFGAEALIRWNHPEKGLVPPLDFLPIIEGSELEIKVGNWVINQALQQLDTWQQQGITLEVSVNISSYHLLSTSFFSELESALADHPEVDSNYLQLEILESSALSDLDAISSIIKTCQSALGTHVALDDFGTGYSSLTHLRNLSADTIKIDQSFVRDMLDDPSDYAIIDGVIGLASSFNREVIAEGVESTNHGLMLLLMGCEQAQGYGIAKPMPAGEFPTWLSNYTPNQEWLHYGNKYHTAKENKLKLFRLVTEHWKDRFISNIQSAPETVEHWPIMDSKHCPCSVWIKREKQEQLFEEEGLKRLDKAHQLLHLKAHTLLFQFKDGDLDAAREGLSEFQATYDDMSQTLGMCE